MITEDDFLAGARAVYTRKFAAWRSEKIKLDQMVAEANAEKRTIMVPNYWQPEWRAREQLKAAEEILLILQT